MSTLRFLGLAAGMFAAVFFGMKWLFTVHPLKPDARLPAFQQVDKDSPRFQLEQSSISDDDATRDRLRHEVLDGAKALDDDPCNDVVKGHYVKAVNDYARAYVAIAPCLGTRSCRASDSAKIERAQHAFGSPLDRRLREAMIKVHAKATFKLGDFPNDTAPLVAEMAADSEINPRVNPPPSDGAIDPRDPRAYSRLNGKDAVQPQRGMPIGEIRAQLGDPRQRRDCGH
jgi:hypothetical protein